MKINVAKSAGFCLGVKRAIEIALRTAKSNKEAYMLGNIVHNEDVATQIQNAGIKKIKKLGHGKNKTFLIRAHGIPLSILKKALKNEYNIVDATCPMVKEIHKIVQKMEKSDYAVIVIGDKNHDEVHGIIGQLAHRAVVIENPRDIPLKKIRCIKKACVVAQSTQNIENVTRIMKELEKNIEEIKFFNTICKPTRIKQEEIKRMPKENDVMIIIGSRTSANTKRLYEISKSINPRSYWVASKDQIQKDWFKDAENAGITAGASTPDSTTKSIVEHIEKITKI